MLNDRLFVFQVQLGYVLQQLGKEKEAQSIYNAVLRAKPADIGLVAVASNNLITINRSASRWTHFLLALLF
jgi:signal recognition particle subunit SRP72